MANSRRNKMPFARNQLVTLFGLGVVTAACTPASPDSTGTGTNVPGSSSGGEGASSSSGGGGSNGGSGSSGGGTSNGAAGSTSSGGSSGSGATGSSGSSGSESSSGGNPSGSSGGSSGSSSGPATGGSSSSGASGGSSSGGSGGKVDGSVAPAGDGGAGTGCGWIQNADGTTNFDPAAPGKIVLFDGSTLTGWHTEQGGPIKWTLNGDGTMTVVPSGTGQATEVLSDQKFENLCVHVEYMTPMYPSSVTGQQRGNSGVYLKGAYEMQILDSVGQPPDINTCGAVYSIMKPLVVACHMELVWNTYEIEFKSSVWNTAVTPAVKTGNAEFIKCALNGQIVQLNVMLNPAAGYTQAGIPDAPGPQSLGLQDHLDLVSFRNVWVRVPQ